jgi:calpain-15
VCGWKRPNEVFRSQNYFLYDKLDISDINQGQLGNCYFLSALSALAEFPDRYKKIFVNNQKSDNGCYAIKLQLQGIPKIVTIDDHFPAIKGNWFAASSGMKEIWVNVMEKAWAKVNKSYASTIAGLPSESLSCITEAPCFSYIHRKFTEDKIWSILLDADQKDHIICTNTGNNADAEDMGLVKSHAYTVISLYDYQGLKILKVRNPWGAFEWKGDYCDNSEKWKEKPELKQIVGYQKQDDGIFFMTFQDFLKYFPYTFVCKYNNGYFYSHQKVHQVNNNSLTVAKFSLSENASVTVGLHQKQQRFYSKVSAYKPQMSRVILAKKLSNGNYEFINSDSSDNEKLYIEADLAPGEYHIIGHVNWPYNTPCRYVFSTYASTQINLQTLDTNSLPSDYFVKLLQHYMDKNCKSSQMTQNIVIQTSTNDNDIGFYMVNVKNISKTETYRVKMIVDGNDKVIFVSNQEIISKI